MYHLIDIIYIGTTTSSKVKSSRWAKIQPEVNNRTTQNRAKKREKIPRQVRVCDQKAGLFTSICFFFFEWFSCFVARAKTRLRGTTVGERSFVVGFASFTGSFLAASPQCTRACFLATYTVAVVSIQKVTRVLKTISPWPA